MAKGEIVIDETRCKGCGYCVIFCKQKCIEISGDKYSKKGYPLAVTAETSGCTGCGICGWMCPDQAIEVYRLTESKRT